MENEYGIDVKTLVKIKNFDTDKSVYFTIGESETVNKFLDRQDVQKYTKDPGSYELSFERAIYQGDGWILIKNVVPVKTVDFP